MNLREVYLLGKDKIRGAGIDNPGLETSLLISKVLGMNRIDIYTQPEIEIGCERLREFEEIINRRTGREPIAYILGEKEFYSRHFVVSSSVLIPRRETEKLVEETLYSIRNITSPRVIDVGTGSGCIAITIGSERSDSVIIASDISIDAILVAKENANKLNTHNVSFVCSDFLNFVKERSFDIVVSNPPYISESELCGLEPDIRDFEPIVALHGGEDGLDCISRVASGATSVLKSGGWCIIEIGADQYKEAAGIFSTLGYRDISFSEDLSGIKRIIKGRWII
ncbi:MAG: peptide chain release factor N(5)-glutamine methyltransferase [Deltaproteobacteria bacterium]|nr:peptide chain release factor N(5)-glutamine methyltransferase [Deltaproteobacteria bacterium]